MQTLSEMIAFILGTLGSLYISLVLMRFLLQLVRADYYNPISKGLVKLTNPLLVPLRKVIPGFGGIDWAAIVLVLLLQMALVAALTVLQGGTSLNPLFLFAQAVFKTLYLWSDFYFYGMFILIIASWVAPNSYNPALQLLQQVMEPVMRPFRKIIPPMGGIDISPIFFLLALQLVQKYILPQLSSLVLTALF